GAAAILWPVSASAGRRAALLGFIALGVALATPQLLPTWELKAESKRSEADFVGQVSYGRIPPGYLLQLAAPWILYDDPDGWLKRFGGDSNRIEAHLQFGVAAIAVLAGGLILGRGRRPVWIWLAVTAIGVVLATGLPFVVLRHLPGFSFFRYPGRYGLLAALAGAMAIGWALQGLGKRFAWAALVPVLGTCYFEFSWTCDKVGYAMIQRPPALADVKRSPILNALGPGDRVFGPDGNTLSLGGAACVPPYIGLEPAIYHRMWSPIPDVFKTDVAPTPEILDTLRKAGVTHLVTEKPIRPEWPATPVLADFDPFLHRRWGRNPSEPLHLYRFTGGPGRAWMETSLGEKKPLKLEVDADRFAVEVPATAGVKFVHAAEWRLPGWRASFRRANGDELAIGFDVADPFFRVQVPPEAGRVEFRYSPVAFWRGVPVTIGAAIGLVGLCVMMSRKQAAG
ncbi:MAG TPA: hypothetical protein VNC50_09525, partial [Planctomycetia bacterium]|nr:hypothetical protein [Planctomycetia bacterium]